MKCFEEIQVLEVGAFVFSLGLRFFDEGWSSFIEREDKVEETYDIVWGSEKFALPEEALAAAREEFQVANLEMWHSV